MAKITEPGWWGYDETYWTQEDVDMIPDNRRDDDGYTRLVPLPEREALANWFWTRCNDSPQAATRHADALIAWLKSGGKEQ